MWCVMMWGEGLAVHQGTCNKGFMKRGENGNSSHYTPINCPILEQNFYHLTMTWVFP